MITKSCEHKDWEYEILFSDGQKIHFCKVCYEEKRIKEIYEERENFLRTQAKK